MTMTTEMCKLVVEGHASLNVPRDLTTVTFNVSGNERNSRKATAALTRQNTAVIEAVTAQGVDRDNLKTGRMYVRPVGSLSDNEGFDYCAEYRISFPNDPRLLFLLVEALHGIDSVSDIKFDFDCSDLPSARNAAIDQAARAAMEKARVLTSAVGVRMGAVLRIDDDTGEPYTGAADLWDMDLDFGDLCTDDSDSEENGPEIDIKPGDRIVTATVELEIEVIND